ncbi:hypothetical protein Tco_1031097 [Tanacetum coccineum]|uniref:Uncharacterized protein n=1 Tax=Tanacetum coccineum TaxID=301880 RepID=A0ABQ5G8C7_9ASTR
MTTPSPSPPISLPPPSAGERLARCMASPAHSPPLLPSSGCPTQIQTLRIVSTQALIDAVTAALPSPPLPPLSRVQGNNPTSPRNGILGLGVQVNPLLIGMQVNFPPPQSLGVQVKHFVTWHAS